MMMSQSPADARERLSLRLGNKDNGSGRSIRAARLRYSDCFSFAVGQFRIMRWFCARRLDRDSLIYNIPMGVLKRVVSYAFPNGHEALLDVVSTSTGASQVSEAVGRVRDDNDKLGAIDGFTVMIRKRPVLEHEVKGGEFDCLSCFGSSVCCHDGRVRLEGLQAGSLHMFHRDFVFDGIFSNLDTNDEVYSKSMEPLLKHARDDKKSATFICHGQTGTGKTFTISGMQRRIASEIFATTAKEGKQSTPVSHVSVEFFELFGKETRDLLANRKRLYLRSDSHNRVHARGSTKVIAKNRKELLEIFNRGNKLRAMEPTERNPNSSRSHSILRITFHYQGDEPVFRDNKVQDEMLDPSKHSWREMRALADNKKLSLGKLEENSKSDGIVEEARGPRTSTLSLVDLAGSERNYETWFHTAEQHKKFVGINQSLMALKECFRAFKSKAESSKLVQDNDRRESKNLNSRRNEDVFIPFHASSLTHLLRECFLNPSHRTVLIATVSPTATDVEHTRETLEHAAYMMGNRRTNEQAFEVDVLDVQTAQLPDAVPMAEWNAEQTRSWILKSLPESKIAKLQIGKNLDGKSLKRMGRSQVTYRVCGGDRELGDLLFGMIRTELKRLDKIDRMNRMRKARRESKGNEESKQKRTYYAERMGSTHGRTPNAINGYRGGGLQWIRRYRMRDGGEQEEKDSKGGDS